MASFRRNALSTLLHPITRTRFVEHYWTQRPVVVRGSPRRLPALFAEPALQSLDGVLGAAPQRVRAWFTDERGTAQSAEVSSEAARTLYGARRLTIVADTLHLVAVGELMNRMKRELDTLQFPIGANAYVSPAGVGTRMHFDEQDVFLVQIRGRKRWRIAPQLQIKHPSQPHFGGEIDSENALLAPQFPAKMPARARTIVLQPGGVLYLPAGTWHESQTLQDSIGLTLTFPSASWLDLLLLRLRARLVKKEAWRAPTVGILAPPSPLQARALETFGALVGSLAEELSAVDIMELLTK